jgi:hypothetical protein
VEQYFSLTANQPQPAYKPKKQPAEQGFCIQSVPNQVAAIWNYNLCYPGSENAKAQ